MIDNLFLEKQKKYLDDFLTEKSYNLQFLQKDTPKSPSNPPISQNIEEVLYSEENRENVDPLSYLKVPNERKVPLDDIPKKEFMMEEDGSKKDKSSLLTRIQNSLKDLTSATNEKTYLIETCQKLKDEKTGSYLEINPKNKDEKTNDTMDLKAKLNQASSLLNLKMSNVKSIFLQNKKKPMPYDIKSFVTVSKSTIKYGNVLPGYIMEDDLEIQNKSSQSLSIKVCVVCHNSELDEHDEYIYSVRKLNIYDYNEKIVSVLPPHNSLKYKIALKVPNLKTGCDLNGSVIVSVQGLESNITIPIVSLVEIPDIFCPKEIFDKANTCSIIKFALKRGKKQDCKIPFKNNSGYNVTMEFEFIEPQGKKNGYDLLTYPSTVNLGANGIGILNVILKPTLNAPQDTQNDNEIRRVLLAKIKNSSMIYYFPLSIEIY